MSLVSFTIVHSRRWALVIIFFFFFFFFFWWRGYTHYISMGRAVLTKGVLFSESGMGCVSL